MREYDLSLPRVGGIWRRVGSDVEVEVTEVIPVSRQVVIATDGVGGRVPLRVFLRLHVAYDVGEDRRCREPESRTPPVPGMWRGRFTPASRQRRRDWESMRPENLRDWEGMRPENLHVAAWRRVGVALIGERRPPHGETVDRKDLLGAWARNMPGYLDGHEAGPVHAEMVALYRSEEARSWWR